MKYFLLFGLLFFLGCAEECDEPNISEINSLRFQLDVGGVNGFFEGELQWVYIVRFVPFSDPLVADTLYLDGFFPEGEGKFMINDEFPFINTGSPYYPVYGYQVVDPSTEYVATIQNIKLRGEYTGDCDYINHEKSFTINGDTVDMAGSDEYYLISQ